LLFEQDALGALRFLRRGQLSLLIPMVQSYRAVAGLSEFGGGFGDVNLSGRWDFTDAGRGLLPGLAVLAGVTLPTGRAPEDSPGLLGTGATGTGTVQANVGVAVEELRGPWLLNASLIGALRSARDVNGIRSQLGPRLTALAGAAYVWKSELALGLLGTGAWEGAASVEGGSLAAREKHLVSFSLVVSAPLGRGVRMQGALFFQPPIAHFGENESGAAGLSVTFATAREFSRR
jgi:hypothetical protein